MRSGRLLFALLVGLLLAAGVVGAWTTSSRGASAPPDDDGAVARIAIVVDGHELAVFSSLEAIRSGYEAEALELSAKKLAVPSKRMPPTVTLKRGMSSNLELSVWHELAMNDWAAARKNTSLVMYAVDGDPVARYHLENAWPAKLEINGFMAGAGAVLMETVTLVSENLQRVSP